MSDDQRTAQRPRGCERCGETPLAGRGLCGYHYAKLRRHLHAVGEFDSIMVPIGPAREHVAALRAAGVGLIRLAQLTGIPPATLCRLADTRWNHTHRHVEVAVLEIDLPTLRVDPLLADGARVSVVPSQRRIRGLAVRGYGQDHLLEHLGMKTGTCALNKIYSALLPQVTAKKHRALAAMFDELVWTPGPSTRATKDATRKGWWGPWAWDDIDDPDCVPDTVPYRMERRRADAHRARDRWLEETLEDHIAVGRVRPDDDDAVAAILGIKPESLEQRRMRAARDAAVAS